MEASAEFTAGELAARFGCELRGDPAVRVTGVCTLQHGREGLLSFLANDSYRRYLSDTAASVVVVAPRDAGEVPGTALIHADPYLIYARIAALFAPPRAAARGVDAHATVAPEATVAATAYVGPHAVIGAGAVVGERVRIGPGCVLAEGVRIEADSELVARVYLGPGVRLGRRVLLHPGVTVGADGFGQVYDGERWLKVPQLGSVRIEDDVEIGANTTIDRGAVEDTVLETGVKLDNQIQVGHNVHIGAHTVIAGCVGISGSTRIGRHCMIGGGVGIGGHLEIADGVTITGMTMVTHSLTAPGVYSSGVPVAPNRTWRRNAMRFQHLDELARRLSALERRLASEPPGTGEEESS